MRSWMYVSECAIPLLQQAHEIERIVHKSISRNTQLGVTGALVSCGDRFAQLIEGPEPAIRELQGAILIDARHRLATTIVDAPIVGRQFDNWALAYSGHSTFFANMLASVALRQEQQAPDVTAALQTLFAAFAGSLTSEG